MNTSTKLRLRWKMEPKETGLRAVVAGPRGYYLHDGATRYASVRTFRRNYEVQGWFWSCPNNGSVEHRNTANALVPTAEDARQAAMKYIKSCLAKK